MNEENWHLGFSTLLGQEFLVKCHVITSLFGKKQAWEIAFYFFPFLVYVLKSRTHLLAGYYMRREMESQLGFQKTWPINGFHLQMRVQ